MNASGRSPAALTRELVLAATERRVPGGGYVAGSESRVDGAMLGW
ncbi:hypothetical protein [Micromonospora chersina]